LKPDNIGFDQEGYVKLFDFGLAKELDPKTHIEDGAYHMTAKTGSRYYMAPEVALSKPYGLSADVYSFAILLWQLCSTAQPFEDMPRKEYFSNVICGKERLFLNKNWSSTLQNIMKWSWAHKPSVRPPMSDISSSMKREIMREEKKARSWPQFGENLFRSKSEKLNAY